MLQALLDQCPLTVDKAEIFTIFPISREVQTDPKIQQLSVDLSPETPWGERKEAARKLGDMRSKEALPWLLSALSTDPFWMVRYAIIQALIMIGDPGAIPALREAAKKDGYQAVRSYAAKAVHRLSMSV
jgi:HEAT repeat protein